VRVLVTGAEGFVGSWLIPRLVEEGHEVVAAHRPGMPLRSAVAGVAEVTLELTDDASVRRALRDPVDAVVHLAAVASGVDARRDPGQAWEVNAAGTARVAEALSRQRGNGRDPMLLFVSTAEVYGDGVARPRGEDEATEPCSPYAASKLGGETAALEVHRRTGLRVVIARPFPHTGPGQDSRFVIPALVERLAAAKRTGAPAVKVGNLDPIRDVLHVADVVEAYVRLLARGESGEVYNVASGTGVSLREVYRMIAELMGCEAVVETDAKLVRTADIRHLVGDATKLRTRTGWRPVRTLKDALVEVISAQTH
jgi:GDP-4-dehydro-6-deoxy-D-mannose reductase